MKLNTALTATAMFAALSVNAATNPPKPQLSEKQVRQLSSEVSFTGALALVKLAFFSEYCASVSNGAPANVPAYKVERAIKSEIKDIPEVMVAYDYAYNGTNPKDQQKTAEYCGGLTVIGPRNEAITGQVAAFETMLDSTRKIADSYAQTALAGQADTQTLTEAYKQMQQVARVFQGAVIQTMLEKPYLDAEHPNLIGTSARPPRPTRAGDDQVSRILDRELGKLHDDLSAVIDANPLDGQPPALPQQQERPLILPGLRETRYTF